MPYAACPNMRLVPLVAIGLALTRPALGQTAPAQPAPATPSTPLDVVVLQDGSMFRGTISELVANDHVVIILVSGESKRFASSAVRYAGPASGAPAIGSPSSPAPSASPSPSAVPLSEAAG